jgi:hypothetical protein
MSKRVMRGAADISSQTFLIVLIKIQNCFLAYVV